MGAFINSVKKVFLGAGQAFGRYPASIACALGMTALTLTRIAMHDISYQGQFKYDFLFGCLYLALSFGAVLSLAAVTVSKTRFKSSKAFVLANLIGFISAPVAFAFLYNFAGKEPLYGGDDLMVSPLAAGRMIVLTVIAFVAFIVAAALPAEGSGWNARGLMGLDFVKSFFMTLKGLFTALVYGWIIFGGVSGVASAFQALLYRNMSEKVFMTVGTLAAFVAFTIFLGYFPDFSKGGEDPNRQTAEKQPRFIEVLFGYILVPIMLALTLVLLAWAVKTVGAGMDVSFVALSSIAAAYTIGGIVLHMLVSSYEGGLAKFYRRFYPLASFVILAFEAWALSNQIRSSGVKLAEYWFILVWITAAAGAILLLTLKSRAYILIVSAACALSLIAVMPAVGYYAVPVKSQTARLESLLVAENMLQNGKLVPAKKEPSEKVRAAITDAVDYLVFANDVKLPDWLSREDAAYENFEKTFGFERAWFALEPEFPDRMHFAISLGAGGGALDISEYDVSLNAQLMTDAKFAEFLEYTGKRGKYTLRITNANGSKGPPVFEVTLDDKLILQKDLSDFVADLEDKYAGVKYESGAPLEDMSLRLESPEIKVMLVFESIETGKDPKAGADFYFIFVKNIFLAEKPE